MSPLTQTGGAAQWSEDASVAAAAKRAVMIVDGAGDYVPSSAAGAVERARFLDHGANQEYELLEIVGADGLVPGIIIADGPDLLVTSRTAAGGAPEAAIIVADGADLAISTNLAATRAAELYLDGAGGLVVCPLTADQLDLVEVGGEILAY